MSDDMPNRVVDLGALQLIRDTDTTGVVLRRTNRPSMYLLLSGPEWKDLVAAAKSGRLDAPTRPSSTASAASRSTSSAG